MIKLFQFPAGDDLSNFSPFCMKLESYLRMTKIPYEVIEVGNPAKSPKGKLPYIEDGDITIADSHFAIQYLKDKYGDILDSHLTPKELAIAQTIQKLLEEHLYWILVYYRWIYPIGWKTIKPIYFKNAPYLLRNIIARRVRKKMQQQLYNQGVGRHHTDEICALGCEDLDTISAILGNKHYLMSDTPTSIDACCYAFLANIIKSPFDNPLKHYLQQQQNLLDYCQRMKQRFFVTEVG
jgi:glutathione S-transferase